MILVLPPKYLPTYLASYEAGTRYSDPRQVLEIGLALTSTFVTLNKICMDALNDMIYQCLSGRHMLFFSMSLVHLVRD